MTYDEFVGQVQHRARLASTGEAVRAIRATLETLGERLFGGAPGNLAAQLPQEIGLYLTQPLSNASFDVDEFFQRVSLREGGDRSAPGYLPCPHRDGRGTWRSVAGRATARACAAHTRLQSPVRDGSPAQRFLMPAVRWQRPNHGSTA